MIPVDPEDIETLEYFAEKVAHLQGLGAAKAIMGSFGSIVEWKREGWDGVFVGPEGEPVEAFILSLRFFFSKNEPISLRRMRALYSRLPIRSSFSERFKEQCDMLNGFLEIETGLSIEEGKQLTYGEIFYLFLYGSLAHGNDVARRRTFRDIRQGSFYPIFQVHFVAALRAFMVATYFLRQINEELLAEVRRLREVEEEASV